MQEADVSYTTHKLLHEYTRSTCASSFLVLISASIFDIWNLLHTLIVTYWRRMENPKGGYIDLSTQTQHNREITLFL